MVRKMIQLTERQANYLKRRADDEGISFSEMIRRSVDSLLADRPIEDDVRKRAMTAVGYASSGDTDVSVRHDEYLLEEYSK